MICEGFQQHWCYSYINYTDEVFIYLFIYYYFFYYYYFFWGGGGVIGLVIGFVILMKRNYLPCLLSTNKYHHDAMTNVIPHMMVFNISGTDNSQGSTNQYFIVTEFCTAP